MAYILEQVRQFAKAHPYALLLNTLFSLTFPIDDILVPFLLGIIITRVQSKGNWQTPLLSMVVILLVMQVIYVGTQWHDSYVIPKFYSLIHSNMVSDVVKMQDGSSTELKMGEVMSRIIKVPAVSMDLFQTLKNQVFPYMLSFVFTACAIFYYDKVIGITVLLCAILIFALVLTSPAFCTTPTKTQESMQARIDEETEDLLQNIASVYVVGKEDEELARLKKHYRDYETAYSKTAACVVRTRFLTVIVLGIMMGLFMYRSYSGLTRKTMNIGAFVTIITILGQWVATLGWIAGSMKDIIISWGILNSFSEMQKDVHRSESIQPTYHAASQPQTPIQQSTAISLRNVSYHINGHRIIDDLTLDIARGERIALVGEIGSGKSTIAKLLLGLKRPISGRIFINGMDTAAMNRRELNSMIGYVQQNPSLFNRSIIDNIKYGTTNVDTETVLKLIDSLGLTNALVIKKNDNAHDFGLNALAGKGGSKLSGGQRQLIACMRALLMNPPILILDEITSSIDLATKRLLFKVLERLFEDKTVIMITHDRDMLALATRDLILPSAKFGAAEHRSSPYHIE